MVSSIGSRFPGSAHAYATGLALFVTLLWSSSYVFITIGLGTIPALTFAGLRYGIASVLLLPVLFARGGHRSLTGVSTYDAGLLVLLGVFMYAITQGAKFVALQYLQSATVSLLLQFTPVVVAGMAAPALGERPSGRQLVGIAVLLVGAGFYFVPLSLPYAEVVGLTVMGMGVVGNAVAAVLGRRFTRGGGLSALTVTTVSMSVGSVLLLGSGLATQGMPAPTWFEWGIVGWLAVVNTAIAFTLWNRSLQVLSAVESSVVNNTMLVQVAVLGWVFLGEALSTLEVVGLGVAVVGALIVRVAGRP